MADKVKAVPEGFHTLTPHLTVRDARRAIDFYQKAFGAEVIGVHDGPEGKIMHATLKIGDSMLMLNDEFPEWGSLGPPSAGGIGVIIHMYLENVDAAFQRVVSAGATIKMPLSDAFWGDRYGAVVDPFGHTWSLASKVKDVSKDELDKAAPGYVWAWDEEISLVRQQNAEIAEIVASGPGDDCVSQLVEKGIGIKF